MNRLYCKFEKIGEIAIAAVLLLIAILFCLAGLVILAPVLGLFLAVPVIAFSIYLFSTPPTKTCAL
jgi:hypothetical protein